MRRFFILLIMILSIRGVIAVEPLMDIDFNAIPQELKLSKEARLKNGILELNAMHGGFLRANLPVKIDRPCRVILRIRETEVPQKESHWGIVLSGAESSGQFYSRGKGLELLRNGKAKGIKGFGRDIILEKSSDAEWTELSITVRQNKVIMEMAGQNLGSDSLELLPLNELSVYAYNNHVEISKLTIFPLSDEELTERPGKLVFHASFDESVPDNTVQRIGVSGQGGGKKTLSWPVSGLLGDSGAIMFWFSPGWDAIDDNTTYPLLELKNKDNSSKLKLFLWNWLRCDISFMDGRAPISVERLNRHNWFKDDWIHLAVTWSIDGSVKLFVNGLPYLGSYFWRKDSKQVTNIDMKSAAAMQIEQAAKGSFDELKIYDGAVSNAVIYNEYRKFMPVDMVIRNAAFMPDREESIGVRLAPGGYYMRPMPVEQPFQKELVDFTMVLLDKQGKVLDRAEHKIQVDEPVDILLPPRKLPLGEYRLRCAIKGKYDDYRRTYLIRSMDVAKAAPVSGNDYKTGKLLFEKKLAGLNSKEILSSGPLSMPDDSSYLEAGSAKGNRFSFVVPMPEEILNRGPVLLEIDWPDDKPRNMGLYMYRESKNSQHRDRLQGGIQAGHEYPSSGKVATTRYLFYPGVSNYLFEARTMAKGYPAAVSAVRVYEIPGGLPKLAVHRPKGLQGRSFGHLDEDQTLGTSLIADNSLVPRLYKIKYLTDALLNYFDYTGQNTFHYPFIRYGEMFFYNREGSADNGIYGGGIGELPWLIEAYHRRDKSVTGILATTNIPEATKFDLVESGARQRGMFMHDRNGIAVKPFGSGNQHANFIHPEARGYYLDHIREVLETVGKQKGIKGFQQWLMRYGAWLDLNSGYDDYTVNAFVRDTGIKVPEKNRFEFLTVQNRKEWLAWRANQVTDFVGELRKCLNSVNPDLKMFAVINFDRGNDKDVYVENGIELEALRKIPGVYVVPLRFNTQYRHDMHWGKPENNIDAELYDVARQVRNIGMGAELTASYPSYFETFTKPLDNKRFAAYFENADIKPHGRFFLKELVFNVAANDAQEVIIGAQPIGTWGRDAEAREFALAFGALPRMPFRTVKGSPDPVAVRYLPTENGTYFYVANMLFSECEVELVFSEKITSYTDLSSESVMKPGKINLKPFQLRSFLISGKQPEITSFNVVVPEKCRSFYHNKLAEFKEAVKILESDRIDVSAEKKVIGQLVDAIDKGHYAEAHRIAFMPVMNQLAGKLHNRNQVSQQVEMIRANTFAVNCGSSDYYVAANGKIFFPDRHYTDEARYGYFGSYKSVMRNISQLLPDETPEVYVTEAYDIDGYRFKLENGGYKVRLYLKIGYEPRFSQGKFVFSVSAGNKLLFNDLDLFEKGEGNFGKPVILEFDGVEVTGGSLELNFRQKAGLNGNIRLCNAIEIIPEKKEE